jgi:hypothetical protein
MADHGKVEYATADGNDYPAHEATYESFVFMALAGSICVIEIVLGLAISTITPHWLTGVLVTFILAPAGLIRSLATRSPRASYVTLVIAVIAFALTTLSASGGH